MSSLLESEPISSAPDEIRPAGCDGLQHGCGHKPKCQRLYAASGLDVRSSGFIFSSLNLAARQICGVRGVPLGKDRRIFSPQFFIAQRAHFVMAHHARHFRAILPRMAKTKRRFQRLFLALTVAWILYCLFVQPVLMGREGFVHYQKDRQECYEKLFAEHSNLQECLAQAEQEADSGLFAGFGVEYDKSHSWSYGWYFRVMWQLLIVEIVAPPVLIYGVAWLVAAVSIWIWRGSKATAVPPSSGTQI